MISLEVYLLGLMVVSTLTSLTTEAIKMILKENNVSYRANTLAGIVSCVLSVAVGTAYVVFTETAFNPQTIICLIALMFVSWLCAMVGYDKVVEHLKTSRKD